jgi:phytoene dehydrogenase-like protein
VECSDGSSYGAENAVLSTIHIKHLADMAPKEAFGDDFLEGVETWKAGISLFVTHYASKEPPKFRVAGGTIPSVASGTMATPKRGLRISYDFACRAVNVEDPPLVIVCSTIADPSRAPEDMHTTKVLGNQPYELKDGPEHWDKIRPVPGWAQHRMPITGFYQTTTHPGESVSGGPGRNAAAVMPKDFGSSLEEIVVRENE